MIGDPDSHGEADAAWALGECGVEVEYFASVPDRCTPLGRFLRRFSLDELPQLVNVLRGEMSFIGPRPERTNYVRTFDGRITRYGDRHRVKPGITGWAQVHGLRGETSLKDRVDADNWYIEHWSFWLDLKIAVKTLPAIFRRR
jgi:lipopolysaccharide/colanic/teichoic acid biosynthesis glycosyltransferase